MLFLLSVNLVQAQNDTVVVDEPVPIVEEYDEDDDDTDKEKEYFVAKADYDSFRINERRIPADKIKQLQEDEAFWYATGEGKRGEQKTQPNREEKNGIKKQQTIEKEPDIESSEPYVPLSKRSWFQTLMWIVIVAGFAGAIIWYLAGSNVGLFRSKAKPLDTAQEEELPEDIFAINYQKEIDKAAAQGNYRLAIRLMYLRLLKDLTENNIIQYKQDRTNFDYLLQLQPTAYYKDFFRVTRHYEYSWYGKFDVSADAYGIIKNEFDGFKKISSYR